MSGHGIPHHAEKDEHRRVGIYIAILAVLMAVSSAMAKQQANRMIVKEVQASNGFSWYQAKRQRSYMNELEIKRIDIELAGTVSEAQRKLLEEHRGKLKAKNAEYEKENDEIRRGADLDRHHAEVAAHRHHGFEYSEIVLHIAMVLFSVSLLIDSPAFVRAGGVTTIVGVALALWTYLSSAGEPQGAATGSESPPAKVQKG